MKQYVALAAVLISSLVAGEVMAGECGQAKLVEAGSVGVKVSQNTCENARLKLGSVVELSAGSRMWVKFDTSAKGESFQLICQNKSAEAVSVNVTSATSPWIKAQGLKNCDTWTKNKLSCESNNGDKNSFFCAIASAKAPALGTKAPENTTSVKMRGIFPVASLSAEEIAKSIEPDIMLCKSLYNMTDKLEMSWTVSSNKINNLSIKSESKDLVSCVEAVVDQANKSQDISITHTY